MPYGAASGVAALCQDLLGGSSAFSASTVPNGSQVDAFLDDGAAFMDALMARTGLTVPVTDATALLVLAPVNEMYASARVEDIHNVVSVGATPGESQKGSYWQARFDDTMGKLLLGNAQALAALGATRVSDLAEGFLVGGLSKDQKDAYEDDSDFVKPEFWSGMLDYGTRSMRDERDY